MTPEPSRPENNPGWSHYVLVVGRAPEIRNIAGCLQDNRLFTVTADDAVKAGHILRGLRFDYVLVEPGDSVACSEIVRLVRSQAPLQEARVAIVEDGASASQHLPEGVEILPRDPATIADRIRSCH